MAELLPRPFDQLTRENVVTIVAGGGEERESIVLELKAELRGDSSQRAARRRMGGSGCLPSAPGSASRRRGRNAERVRCGPRAAVRGFPPLVRVKRVPR